MSSGSWNKGNGLSRPNASKSSLSWTRSWNGGDSFTTKKVREPSYEVVKYTREARKVTYTERVRTKSGKWINRKREVWVVTRTPVRSTRPGKSHLVRTTVPEKVEPVYGSTAADLIPNAVKRREEEAGLNNLNIIEEKLPQGPRKSAVNPALPKRARLSDNAYTMSEMFMLNHYVKRIEGYTIQFVPEVCDYSTEYYGAIMDFMTGDWSATNLLDANHQIKLVNKLRDKVVGSEFNAAVFLGEANESIDLILRSAVRINRYLTELRRGNFRNATRALVDPAFRSGKAGTRLKASSKEIASQHLQNVYGWMPLLQDAKSGAEALAHQLNTPMQKTYRVSVRAEVNSTSTVLVPKSCGIPAYSVDSRITKSHRRGLIVRFREKPSIPKLLGLTDPEVVAWEKVPFSFIADWFIPVGDWLTARGFASGLDATFVTSDKRIGEAFEPVPSRPGWHFTVYRGGLPPASFKQVLFDRVISSSLSIPKPEFKPLNKALSWAHVTNAVALLVSNHGGRGYK